MCVHRESQFIGFFFFFLTIRSGLPLSGLYLEKALELEGHHLPVITGTHWEGHPVAGGFGQHARWGRLAELGPCIAWASLGGQKRVEVWHRAFPVLVIAGGKTNRGIFLCGHGLPCLWRPVVSRAFVTPAVPMVVKAPYPSCRCRSPVLVTVPLLSPTKLVVFLGQRALRVGNWNVVPLSTSHNAFALGVTCIKSHTLPLDSNCNNLISIILFLLTAGTSPPLYSFAMKTNEGYVQKQQPRRPLPHTHSQTAPAHLFVVRKSTKQISLFNLSPPTGPQVLEVVLNLLLTALWRPARSRVFMCQWALFFRGAELNINSPRHTMLQEVADL